MVYTGPSKGCRICRTRRVKCDQARPACANCVKRKQSCPGYGDTVDRMFRNKSSTSVKRNGLPAGEKQNVALQVLPTATRDSSFVTFVPCQLPDDFESTAISFFFEHFVTHPRDDGATAGILEHLSAFYANAPIDSPLSLATKAISTSFGNAWFPKPVDPHIAQVYYLKAVTKTNKVLANPLQNRSDEVLMTVLVMEFYDAIFRRLLQQDASDIHQSGAAALVRHRGPRNYDTELSKHLLLAVRSRTVQIALTKKHGVDLDTRLWNDGNDVQLDPATQVDVMAAQLCVLRARIHQLRTQLPNSNILHTENQHILKKLHEILNDAIQLNAQLRSWKNSLPRFWYPISVTNECIHPAIISAGTYGGACDVYDCFQVATVWNHYRNVRLGVLQILEKYKAYALWNRNGFTSLPPSYATTEIQMIIDDVCASIPFHLGNLAEPLTPYTIRSNVLYPKVPTGPSMPITYSYSDHDSNEKKYSHAQMKGGWFLITILLTVSQMNYPDEDGFMVFEIRKEQRDWVLSQMERIRRVYNIDMPLW